MSHSSKKRLKAAVALAGALFFASDVPQAAAHWATNHRGAPSWWREEVGRPAPKFELIDQNGRPFSLSDNKGKAILITFVFTSCTDLCPLVTSQMAEVARRIGSSASVHLVTVTTNPEVDRAEVLRAYGRRFGADPKRWSFLTGPRRKLVKVWSAYGVTVTPIARGLVDHNYVLALIDSNGIWRATYHGEAWNVKQVVEEFRRLLSTSVVTKP
jgi:protein SCO1/2